MIEFRLCHSPFLAWIDSKQDVVVKAGATMTFNLFLYSMKTLEET